MQEFHCKSMLSDSWPCSDTPESNQNEVTDETDRNDLPFSSSFPAFTTINRRRRIKCRFCDIPLGYVDITMAHLEAALYSQPQKCQTTSDDKRYQSLSISRPVNVSLNPRRLGNCDLPESENKFMTWILEDGAGNSYDADEVICDGCGSSLGARITSYERKSSSTEVQNCEATRILEERSQWYSLALDCVNIEPFFGIVGSRELSSWFHGGERFSYEIQAIEDSEEFSNNSLTWLRPCQRVKSTEVLEHGLCSESWPFFYMDLVRASELPEGTIDHVDGKTMAYLDNRDAFKRKSIDLGVGDDSIMTQVECASEAETNLTIKE